MFRDHKVNSTTVGDDSVYSEILTQEVALDQTLAGHPCNNIGSRKIQDQDQVHGAQTIAFLAPDSVGLISNIDR